MWTERLYNTGLSANLAENGVLNVIAQILAGRDNGISGKDDIGAYAAKKLGSMASPRATAGMEKAAKVVRETVKNGGNNVAVFGDYDVDGITSSRICSQMLIEAGFKKVSVYIPNRIDDGYGLNDTSIDNFFTKMELHGFTPDLVMVLDCGTSSDKQVRGIKERWKNVPVVVVDHHIVDEKEFSASADVVVNPRLNDSHPFCTAGLMYQFARELLKKEFIHEKYAAHAAIGTIADVCFMQGSNRTLAHHGLNALKTTTDIGLSALLSSANINRDKIDEGTVGFNLAPALNASGRLSDPMLSYGLLASKDTSEAQDMARRLIVLNNKRKEMQQEIIGEIESRIGKEIGSRKSIVAIGKWHVGIVGIVAGHLAEKYRVPVLCFGIDENGKCTGSGRTKTGINIKKAMDGCSEIFVKYGGHEMAAGATLNKNYAEKAWDLFDASVRRLLAENTGKGVEGVTYDVQLSLTQFRNINMAFCEKLNMIGPFGSGNEKPIFLVEGVKCKSVYEWKSGKGGQLSLAENDMEAYAMVPELAKKVYGKRIDILFSIERSFKDDVIWALRIIHARTSKDI